VENHDVLEYSVTKISSKMTKVQLTKTNPRYPQAVGIGLSILFAALTLGEFDCSEFTSVSFVASSLVSSALSVMICADNKSLEKP